jgi:hypothetical protein
MSGEGDGLTAFQEQVVRLFFDLSESAGFLLAGGAALIAQLLTARATQDLDFFTSMGHGDASTARDSFERTVVHRGWKVNRNPGRADVLSSHAQRSGGSDRGLRCGLTTG